MSEHSFSVVSGEEATQTPYPYVYLNEDGTFRELDVEDREYLEQRFSPTDGARPYIKFGLYSKTPDGKIEGFLSRSKLPANLEAGAAIPPKPWWRFWP